DGNGDSAQFCVRPCPFSLVDGLSPIDHRISGRVPAFLQRVCCQLYTEPAMRKHSNMMLCGFLLATTAALSLTHLLTVRAQQTERPGNSSSHPIDMPRDLSGLSIKNPRIRVVHTIDPARAGGSMYLQQVDPWLGYQWGRSLFQRNFRERDGVYGEAGKLDGITLPDGASKMMDRGH